MPARMPITTGSFKQSAHSTGVKIAAQLIVFVCRYVGDDIVAKLRASAFAKATAAISPVLA